MRKNPPFCRSMTIFMEANVSMDLRMLRSFRVLRPLKLVSRIPSKCGVKKNLTWPFPLALPKRTFFIDITTLLPPPSQSHVLYRSLSLSFFIFLIFDVLRIEVLSRIDADSSWISICSYLLSY